MKYNGISINERWAATKTEAEFVEHEKHHGLTEKQLKEAYALMFPKKKLRAVKPDNDSSLSVEKDIS